MKPPLSDLVAASWIAACAGAAAFHVCMALGLASNVGFASPTEAVGSFATVLLLTLLGAPFSVVSFLFVGSFLGPITYRIMARLGLVRPIDGIIAGAIVGATVGVVLWRLAFPGPGTGAWFPLLFAAPTAFAGWIFERSLRRMGPKPPPAPPSAAPTP